MSEIGASKFSTPVSEEAAYLRDSSPERQLLFKLLEVYWGPGDGEQEPLFIQRAAALCGYPLDRPLLQMGEDLRPTTPS